MHPQEYTTAPRPTRQAPSWPLVALIVLLIVGLAQPIGAAAATATNPRAPAQPAHVHATAADGAALVSWTAPYDSGTPITSYTVTVYQGDTTGPVALTRTVGPDMTSVRLIGVDAPLLKQGVPYTFTVSAANAFGNSLPSNPSNTVTWLPNTAPPGRPQNLAATPAVGWATLTWTAPADGGTPIMGYEIALYRADTQQVVEWMPVAGNVTAVMVSGLDNGTPYTFTVQALNAIGWGPTSDLASIVTPNARVPDAPTNVQAVADNNAAAISWTAPYDGGSPILEYIVTAYLGATSNVVMTREVLGNATDVRLIGVDGPLLHNGTPYSFTVTAVNAVGRSVPSARSNLVTLANRPEAPTNVQAVAGPHWADVSWSSPDDGVSPITKYTVRAYLGATSTVVATREVLDTTSVRLIGVDRPLLQNGNSYTFTVTATNAVGESNESARSNQITLPAAPGQPQNLTVTPGDARAQVRWDAPASDGGSPITGYVVTATDGIHTAITLNVSNTSATLTGLNNDAPYTVSVVAINALGESPAASASVTPKNEPPTLTVPGDQSVLYGHALNLQIAARGPEATDHLTLSAGGLPDGLTFKDNGDGTGTVSGAVQAPAGTYTATFSVSDGHNPAVSHTLAIVVSPARAMIKPAGSNPVKVQAAGGWARVITLRATVWQTEDDVAGDIANVGPVTFKLTSLGSRARRTCTAPLTDNGDGTASISCTFRQLPVGMYGVDLGVANQYYRGSGQSMLAVYDPGHRLSIRGSGGLRHDGAEARFNFTATSSSTARGFLRYTELRDRENLMLRSTAVDALVIREHTAYLQGQATLNRQSGYRFILTASSNGYRSGSNRLGLWVLDGNGTTVSELTFDPVDFSTGRTTISTH